MEPHIGAIIDTPAKVLELLEIVNSPYLKVNFDISHFDIVGMPTEGDGVRVSCGLGTYTMSKTNAVLPQILNSLSPAKALSTMSIILKGCKHTDMMVLSQPKSVLWCRRAKTMIRLLLLRCHIKHCLKRSLMPELNEIDQLYMERL